MSKSKKSKSKVSIKKTQAKTAIKSINTYEKNVKRGSEKKFGSADQAAADVKKFLNKNGTISKTKTRTKKAKREFNAATANYNSIAKTKKARTENKYNQEVAGAAKSLQKHEKFVKGGDLDAKANQAAKIFMNKTLPAFKQFSTSEVVLILTDAGLNMNDIYDVINYLDTQLNNDIPDDLAAFRSDDDITVFLDNIVNIHLDDPSIPASDVIMMSQQMTDYGFDDTEEVIRQYYEDKEF